MPTVTKVSNPKTIRIAAAMAESEIGKEIPDGDYEGGLREKL